MRAVHLRKDHFSKATSRCVAARGTPRAWLGWHKPGGERKWLKFAFNADCHTGSRMCSTKYYKSYEVVRLLHTLCHAARADLQKMSRSSISGTADGGRLQTLLDVMAILNLSLRRLR